MTAVPERKAVDVRVVLVVRRPVVQKPTDASALAGTSVNTSPPLIQMKGTYPSAMRVNG